MPRLDALYAEIAGNPRRWLYYAASSGDKLSISICWENENDAVQFIKKHFEIGGKDQLITDQYLQEDIEDTLNH